MGSMRTIFSQLNKVVAHIDLVKINHPEFDKAYRVIFTEVKTQERVGVPQYFATLIGAESCVRRAFHKEVAA
jgi:hypothetical protein